MYFVIVLSSNILPAHAGMTLIMLKENVLFEYITRTCGDDPEIESTIQEFKKYYPHMRG